MRDRIIIIAGLLFIAVCAIFTVTRISSHYSTPGYLAPSPAPLLPTASATAAGPASTAPAPRRTVTVTVTATPPAGGEAGP
jgi:hypothetical protein